MKNSGLMIYTVLLKKMLVQSVNKSTAANYTVAQFFVKFHYLKHWFSLKLAAPSAQSTASAQAAQEQQPQQPQQSQQPQKEESKETIAGLHPILFSFIVLTARLNGNGSDAKDGTPTRSALLIAWLTDITSAIAEVNASPNLFCRTMSAQSLVRTAFSPHA